MDNYTKGGVNPPNITDSMNKVLDNHFPKYAPPYRKSSITKEDLITALLEAYMLGKKSQLDEIRRKI